MQLHGRQVGIDQPIFLIAGPCVMVDLDWAVKEAGFEEMAL